MTLFLRGSAHLCIYYYDNYVKSYLLNTGNINKSMAEQLHAVAPNSFNNNNNEDANKNEHVLTNLYLQYQNPLTLGVCTAALRWYSYL